MIRPDALPPGGTIGVFTPSTPAHVRFRRRFDTAVANIEALGFKVVLGSVTARFVDQGYRTASGRERAEELNELFRRDDIQLLMATIGGANSSSLLEHLDYRAMAGSRKIVCGYSDVTSLHMAINTRGGLATLYGPAVMPSFGDDEGAAEETLQSFLDQVQRGWTGTVPIPSRWSCEGPDWRASGEGPNARRWQDNPGLRCLRAGQASGPALAANVNTLVCLAGTPYFPDCRGRILFLEEMSCPLSRFERNLTQLRLAGALHGIAGVVLSKPENYDAEGAAFDDGELLLEVLGNAQIPVIGNFDSGHTHPMLSIPQGVEFEIRAADGGCEIRQLERFTAALTTAPAAG